MKTIINRFTFILSMLMFGFVSSAFADIQTIQQTLKKMVPDAPDAKITQSVIPGLYQVILGTRVLYIDQDAKYVLSGNLISLNTRENLTQSAENGVRKSILAGLDETKMVIYPSKGETKYTITVFSDIDCPYCRKFHAEIPALNEAGIKVRYLSFPRAGVGSESYHKAVSAWCATDRVKALNQVMSGVTIPEKTCKNPVVNDMKLAELFGVNGTPNLLLDDGELLPGYVPAKDLIRKLTSK